MSWSSWRRTVPYGTHLIAKQRILYSYGIIWHWHGTPRCTEAKFARFSHQIANFVVLFSKQHFDNYKIGGCRQNGLLIPCSPFSQHPPIRRHSLPQLTSQNCISPRLSSHKLTLSLSHICKIHHIMVPKVTHGTERGLICSVPWLQYGTTLQFVLKFWHRQGSFDFAYSG